MFSKQSQWRNNICNICGGEVERKRNKSRLMTSQQLVDNYRDETVTHILSAVHQQTSLRNCLSWTTTSEKLRTVVIRNKGTALEPEGILQRFGSRIGFEKLANFILIPDYPKPTAAIVQFVNSSDLEDIWSSAEPIKYFRKLAWNLDNVVRATYFSLTEWIKLVLPNPKPELWPKPNSKPGSTSTASTSTSTSSSSGSSSSTNSKFLTANDIRSMISVTVLHTLNQFCSLNNWPPPIFLVKEMINSVTHYTFDVIVNEKSYKAPVPTLDKVFVARSCLLQLISEFTFPTKDELYNCDSYKVKLRKFVEQRGLTMSDFKIYRETHLHPIGRIYYYSISINARCYKSRVPATTRQEGEYFAAFYCLEELKRKLGESASTSSNKRQRPLTPPQTQTGTRVDIEEGNIMEVDQEIGNEMENLINIGNTGRKTFSKQNQWSNEFCHICGGGIERQKNKSSRSTSRVLVDNYRNEIVTHILSTVHQQTSLSQCLSWTSEKQRAVVIRSNGTALEPESILQRFGSRIGFEKLANFILIPEYPKPTAAIVQFGNSSYLENMCWYAKPITYFRRLASNIDNVLLATNFSFPEWKKLLSPKKLELWPKPKSRPEIPSTSTSSTSTNSDYLTADDIESMLSFNLLHTLNQLCSFNNWPPPIFQVNEIITSKTKAVHTLDVIVNEKTYRVPVPTLDTVEAARFCLLKLLSELTFPTKDQLYNCDNNKIKLMKFVEQRGLAMSDFKKRRTAYLPLIGRISYYSISINAQCYTSPVPGTTKEEGEDFAAFYCWEELKRKLGESTSTSSNKRQRPSTPPQTETETGVDIEEGVIVEVDQEVGHEMENLENGSSSSDDDDDRLIVSESGSESECAEDNQLSDDHDDEMDEKDDDEVEVMEVCEREGSEHSREKESEAEITVLGEPKESEEIYLSDDSDIDEIVVLKKEEENEGPMETNAKVKVEESVTPWPTIYLPSDYVNERFQKPDRVLEQICLVCGWEPPVYFSNLESMSDIPNPAEERFSFLLSVNGRKYKNERVEKSKAKAKEKVARICLLELCHLGQIPHPSIFQNISLDPVVRLLNLSKCRQIVLGNDLKAKHKIIQVDNNKYVCKVKFNGKRYSKEGETSHEARRSASSLCLEQLCKEYFANVFAHGSITSRTKNNLTNLTNEISVVPGPEDNKKVKNLTRQLNDTLAKMTIKENELEQTKKLLTTLENFLNKELPINVTLTQFRNSVPHIRNHGARKNKKLHIDIYLEPTNPYLNVDVDTENLVQDALKSHQKKNLFPGVKSKVGSVLAESGPNKCRSTSGTKFKILSKADLTWLPDSFSVHMNNCAKAEMEICRFVDYIATFDPRFVPLLVTVRHWAEVNRINLFKEESKLDADDVSRNSSILDWLVLCYLAGLKIIPAPRKILERPRTTSNETDPNPGDYELFQDDPQFANQWRSSNYKGPEENSNAFSLQIFLLAKYFFSHFGKSLAEGNWILNTRDAELIYTPDFFKGSFITELTPYDLDRLRDMEINGKNLLDPSHKFVIVHPGLESKWKIVVESGSKLQAEHVFKKMVKSGERLLHKNLPTLQKTDEEGEIATN